MDMSIDKTCHVMIRQLDYEENKTRKKVEVVNARNQFRY